MEEENIQKTGNTNNFVPLQTKTNNDNISNGFQSFYNSYENPYNDKLQPYMQGLYIKPRSSYSQTDRIFSIIALILGFAALKVFLNTNNGLGLMATVLCVGITLFNYFFSKSKGLKGLKENTFVFYTNLFLSLMFVVTDNNYVKNINLCIVIVSNLYFVYSSYKSNNNSIIFNVFKAVMLSPFYEFGSLFEALFHKSARAEANENKKPKKNILMIISGIIFSIPVCIIVMILLMSSDENFGKIFETIINTFLDWFFNNLFFNLVQLMFSIPISMYIFSAVFSRSYKKKNEKNLKKLPKISMHIIPSSMCNAFLSPLIFIYLAYVFTQISHLFTVFGDVNDTFDYSNYARSGFFELCTVVIINLTVISIIMFLVKLRDKNLPKSVKGFIISFSVLTLCLIVTAITKMTMYIDMFGMTPLRIYTSIFMIYLFVMFIVLIVKQFMYEISFTKISYILAVFVIAAMSVMPVDGYIARYNIEKYEQGEISWMGNDAMIQLDASAVKTFAECDPNLAYENIMGVGHYPIKWYFCNNLNMGDMDIYEFNFTRFFAANQIKKFDMKYDVTSYNDNNNYDYDYEDYTY